MSDILYDILTIKGLIQSSEDEQSLIQSLNNFYGEYGSDRMALEVLTATINEMAFTSDKATVLFHALAKAFQLVSCNIEWFTNISRILLENGADVNKPSYTDTFPATYLIANSYQNPWIKATRGVFPFMELYQTLLSAGMNVNVLHYRKRSPLTLALTQKYEELALKILDRTDDKFIHFADDKGNTPLHHAMQSGLSIAAQRIKDRGGSLSAVNKKGQMPFQMIPKKYAEKFKWW